VATKMNVADIIVDMEYQMRATMSEEAIDQYAEEMADGKKFDPVTVVEVESVGLVLAEGFHRVEATKRAGLTSIDANIIKGTLRDVKEHAYGANSAHGVRQTNADKRKKVMKALADPDFSGFRTTDYAAMCQVTERFINKIRHEMSPKPGTVPTLENSLEVQKQISPPAGESDGTGTAEAPAGGEPESAAQSPGTATAGGENSALSKAAAADTEPSAEELDEAEAYIAAARDNLALMMLNSEDPKKELLERNLDLERQVFALRSEITRLMNENAAAIKQIKALKGRAQK